MCAILCQYPVTDPAAGQEAKEKSSRSNAEGNLSDEMREILPNKKVLLCERKRHTTRRVVTTPSVVLTGYPPFVLTWPGGVPGRVPPSRVPPRQCTPPPAGPGKVHPPPVWTWQGTPPAPGVCPMAFWEMLQSIMGYRYPSPPPPPVDRQIDGRTDACQNIIFPSYYVRVRLQGPVYTKRQRSDDACDIALIEKNGVAPKWVAITF